ncbi:MAG: hypothetical protein EZS28_043906, partial [Streblomastix strix]
LTGSRIDAPFTRIRKASAYR